MISHFQLLFTVALASCVSAIDTYPSSYPFENESYQPSAPMAATPSLTYKDDGSDPGGYGYHYIYTRLIVEEDIPYCVWNSGAMKWYAVFHREWPDEMADYYFNCTKSGNGAVMGVDTFPGKILEYTWCDPEDCCKEYYGLIAKRGTGPNPERHDKIQERFTGGVCDYGETYHEAVYCAQVSDDFTSWCSEQTISVTERAVVTPCYDHYMIWIFQACKLYKTTGNFVELFEPPVYTSLSTVQENQAAYLMKYQMNDKICRPYSYYFPETAKDKQKKETFSLSAEEVECVSDCPNFDKLGDTSVSFDFVDQTQACTLLTEALESSCVDDCKKKARKVVDSAKDKACTFEDSSSGFLVFSSLFVLLLA